MNPSPLSKPWKSIEQLETQLHLTSLRLSQSETRLIQTLDSLDALQLSSSRSRNALQNKYDKLKMKSTAYLQCIETLSSERDQLKDVVEEVIAKVEQSTEVTSSVWKPSHIRVNGELAKSLQPQIHWQPVNFTQSLKSQAVTDRESQAAALVCSLQAQLQAERELRMGLTSKITILEAMVGRRDAELQRFFSPPSFQHPYPSSSRLPAVSSIDDSDISQLLEVQTQRNHALEEEIVALRTRLDVAAQREEPRRTSRSRSRRRSATTRSPSAIILPPYASTMERLKALDHPITRSPRPNGPSSRSSSRGKRKRMPIPTEGSSRPISGASPPFSDLISQLSKLEKGMQLLKLEREASPLSQPVNRVRKTQNRSAPQTHIEPLIATSTTGILSDLQATVQHLGKEIDKLQLGRDAFELPLPSAPPSPPSRPASASLAVFPTSPTPMITRPKSSMAEFMPTPSALWPSISSSSPLQGKPQPLPNIDSPLTNFRGHWTGISPPSPSGLSLPVVLESTPPQRKLPMTPDTCEPQGQGYIDNMTHEIRTLQEELTTLRKERDTLQDFVHKDELDGSASYRDNTPSAIVSKGRQDSDPYTDADSIRPVSPTPSIPEEITELSLPPPAHDTQFNAIVLRCTNLRAQITHLKAIAREDGIQVPPTPPYPLADENSADFEILLARELHRVQDLLSSNQAPNDSGFQDEVSFDESPTQTMFPRTRTQGSYSIFSHAPLASSTPPGEIRHSFASDSDFDELPSFTQNEALLQHPTPHPSPVPFLAPSESSQDEIWNLDGERSMELATPLLPSSSLPSISNSSTPSSSSESPGTPMSESPNIQDNHWLGEMTVEEDNEYMEEASIPLPPSP